MDTTPHLAQPDQTFDTGHPQRFLDLVRKALVTPATDALKQQERDHESLNPIQPKPNKPRKR